MSVEIDLSYFTDKEKIKISQDLEVRAKESKFNKIPLAIICFDVVNKDSKGRIFSDTEVKQRRVPGEIGKTRQVALLPFSYCYHYFPHVLNKCNESDSGLPNNCREFSKTEYKFTYTLTEDQIQVRKEVFEILNRTRSVVLAFKTGFGKTLYGIYLAWKMKMKTCILSHRLSIMNQWMSSINKACPDAKVQILGAGDKLNKECDFYILNMSGVGKRRYDDFKDVAVLIVDEIPVVCTEKNAIGLKYFRPKYLIGLSATPTRTDGLDQIIEHYFGPEIIYRRLIRSFNIYCVYTDFIPETEKTRAKKLDWNSVLDSVCTSPVLNILTILLVLFFSDKNILILTKRVEKEGKVLYNTLKALGENVEIYTGTKKKFDFNCRILVSSLSKSGIGFDFPKLNMLLLPADVEEGIEQYIGRVFRNWDHIPVVVELTHSKYRPFYKHINTRKDVYRRCGGTVLPFLNYFPEFKKFEKIEKTKVEEEYVNFKLPDKRKKAAPKSKSKGKRK